MRDRIPTPKKKIETLSGQSPKLSDNTKPASKGLTKDVMGCKRGKKKLVLEPATAYVVLEIQDLKGNYMAIMPLHLKSPFARNFEKLAHAAVSINGFLAEQLEFRKAGGA